MPLPPAEDNEENTNENEPPKLQFSYVECLMFAFHKLGTKYPEFLTAEGNADRLKDFKIRLVTLFLYFCSFEEFHMYFVFIFL